MFKVKYQISNEKLKSDFWGCMIDSSIERVANVPINNFYIFHLKFGVYHSDNSG